MSREQRLDVLMGRSGAWVAGFHVEQFEEVGEKGKMSPPMQ